MGFHLSLEVFISLMTTLFNLFCPIIMNSSIENSIFTFSMINTVTSIIFLSIMIFLYKKIMITTEMFSGNITHFPLYMSIFILLSSLNLISLNFTSFPTTTVLFFNFSLALLSWLTSVFFMFMKNKPFSNFSPSQAPWYLVFFLTLIEMSSFLVRPLTLCFRLLANMSAGHILLSLSTKLEFNLWLLGMSFGLLELVVCMVQGFVFTLLIKVYVEEYS